jgi:hemoglobin
MGMKKEIETFEDVQLLVRSFYNKVLNDEMLCPFFAYVKKHHWNKHLEVLDSFWNSILFYSGDYYGNPLEKHATLHYFSKLEKKNFERWLKLFNQTIDELFYGDKAELAKQRANSIATIMQIKILHVKEENIINNDRAS